MIAMIASNAMIAGVRRITALLAIMALVAMIHSDRIAAIGSIAAARRAGT